MTTPTLSPALPSTSDTQWSIDDAEGLLAQPFMDLLWQAQAVHRLNFDPNAIQRSALFSIKTGGCSEDCKYCSQSARYPLQQTGATKHLGII